MRICVFLLLLISSFIVNAQKQYRCTYRDSTAFIIMGKSFDSMKDTLRQEAAGQGIPENIMDAILEQVMLKLSEREVYNVLEKKVAVRGDTAVLYWNKIKAAGDIRIEELPDSMMMVNDRLYGPASFSGGFSLQPLEREKRNFQPTGKTKLILNYSCREYLSADSTCRIWTTEQLPASINPGIITNGVNGAVLAFEIVKLPLYNRCEIVEVSEGCRKVMKL